MSRLTRRQSIAAVAGVLCAAATGQASAQELKTIRVVGPPNDGFKCVYYGIQSGIFKKYGLDVTTTLVNSGAAAAAALVGGSAEVAYTNSLSLFQAHGRDIPMQYIAGAVLLTGAASPTQTVVLKTSSYHSGRDLTGKTVGSSSIKDVNAAATLAWIDSTGGDSKSVKLIEVPASAATAFLEEGRADAITLNEPAVSQVLASGKARVLAKPYDAIGKRSQNAGFAVMAPVVQKNAEMMSRFARAMHEAQVYTNGHLAQTVDLVASYSGTPADVVAHSVRMIDPEYVEQRNLQPLIDALAKYGFISKAFPAEEIISSAALKPRR